MFEAIDLQPGDEVLCPVYTFFATATPMLQYGAIPVFCDSLSDGSFDPEEIPRKATKKTKAVIVTHMWGLPCDMPTIVKYARSFDIKVLEDCSQAHGAKVGGKLVGTWGDIAAWSLQAEKHVGGGEGGVLATDNTDYYVRAITLGHFNQRAKQEVPENHPWRKFCFTGLGLNMRAHTLAIAMADQQLNWMSLRMSYRDEYAALLSERIGSIPYMRVPKVKNAAEDRHAWYAFIIQFDTSKAPKGVTRELFFTALKTHGLEEVYIPRSIGLLNNLPIFTQTHEAFPRYGTKPWHAPQTGFEVAQTFLDNAIKLPVWAMASDRPIVEYYANTFLAVAEEFMSKKNLEDAGLYH
jgi:dTDP-4-amino-4,6-dideoxygalactose transaminase